ncbi:hypothetical protein [Dyadobacter sp. 3J3]|uniref:hypothetical protein n=1 Tax=Dyadobacter sp. 3J3 TaxID=2606600 RepID=UPI00135AAE65|nr:hypothetical protein [Dyadobacter sp. 3J3]
MSSILHYQNAYKKITTDRILIFFSILLFLPKNLVDNPSGGQDPSWKISINMALHQGLIFGKDWIFTYGPLGFLSTRIPTYVGVFPILLYDIFLVGVLIYILAYTFKELNSLSKCLIVPYFLVLISYNPEATFELFTLFVFLILHHFRTKNVISLILSVIISILIFYIKLNLGIVTSVILYAYLIYQAIIDRKFLSRTLLVITAHVIVTLLLAFFLHVEIGGYIKSALYIIDNYNDAMFSVDYLNLAARYAWFNIALTIIVLLSLIIFLFISSRLLLRTPSDIPVLVIMFLALYLGFKQGFTRFQPAGMPYLFFYGAFFVGIAYLFIDNPMLKNNLGNVFRVFLFVSPFASTGIGLSYNKISLPYQDIVFQNLPFQQKVNNDNYRKEYHLDPAVSKTFRGKTVDVFPYDIAYSFFNDLHYNPRPAIQSYQAYNNYLTTLNYNKYSSTTAPDYILYNVGATTDVGRYNFWGDSKSTLAMLQCYDYQTTTISRDTLQILRKRLDNKKILHSKERNISFKMNQRIALTDSGRLTWMETKVEYSLWGKLKRVLVQPPILKVRATFEDGKTEVFKAIISEIEAGTFLKIVQTENEAEHFFKTGGKAKSITHLEFLQNNAGFQEDISAKLYDVSFE